jgi:hypothetical protein
MGKPGDLGYRVCLALCCFAGSLILLPHSNDHECQQHGVYDTQDSVDVAGNIVVLLALLRGY